MPSVNVYFTFDEDGEMALSPIELALRKKRAPKPNCCVCRKTITTWSKVIVEAMAATSDHEPSAPTNSTADCVMVENSTVEPEAASIHEISPTDSSPGRLVIVESQTTIGSSSQRSQARASQSQSILPLEPEPCQPSQQPASDPPGCQVTVEQSKDEPIASTSRSTSSSLSSLSRPVIAEDTRPRSSTARIPPLEKVRYAAKQPRQIDPPAVIADNSGRGRSIAYLIRWLDGFETWHSRRDMEDNYPVILERHVLSNHAMDTARWRAGTTNPRQ